MEIEGNVRCFVGVVVGYVGGRRNERSVSLSDIVWINHTMYFGENVEGSRRSFTPLCRCEIH